MLLTFFMKLDFLKGLILIQAYRLYYIIALACTTKGLANNMEEKFSKIKAENVDILPSARDYRGFPTCLCLQTGEEIWKFFS